MQWVPSFPTGGRRGRPVIVQNKLAAHHFCMASTTAVASQVQVSSQNSAPAQIVLPEQEVQLQPEQLLQLLFPVLTQRVELQAAE